MRWLGWKPNLHSHSRRHARVGRHFGEVAVPEGECGPFPVFALYPGIHLTTEEKSRINLSQGRTRHLRRFLWLYIRSGTIYSFNLQSSVSVGYFVGRIQEQDQTRQAMSV